MSGLGKIRIRKRLMEAISRQRSGQTTGARSHTSSPEKGRSRVSRIRERLTFANVMSIVAVFIAIGGGAYAAGLAKNSVKSKQIKNGQVKSADLAYDAVSTRKVANGSLLGEDFAAGQLPVGGPGPQGPQGPAGSFSGDVPSGATLRGTYAVRFPAGAAADSGSDSISFGATFSSGLTKHFIGQGVVPPSQCPGNAGSPQAQSGHLCVYEAIGINRSGVSLFTTDFATGPTHPFGEMVLAEATAAGTVNSSGTWAATAP